MRRALLSVSDKNGLTEFARALSARGIELLSTGGTARLLLGAGIAVTEVASNTGFPEIMDGRVKTLHPRVFGAILSDRENPAHRAEAIAHGVPAISVVVVNLYPFESTVAREGATLQEAIEQIDIGGVSLIRAAAKNFAHVSVLVDPDQYASVRETRGETDIALRRRFATRAFERTAEYDSSIARYLEAGLVASELPGSLALTIPLA